MIGQIQLGASPEEICKNLPEPNKQKCIIRMKDMLGEAKKERYKGYGVTAIGTGLFAAFIASMFLLWHLRND